MPKKIIFCADGTWNNPTETDGGIIAPTNVSKFYTNLLNDENIQVTSYDNGVGNSSVEMIKLFEGATGAGLADKIMDGYQYIVNQWQEGDTIYLFGFSRGAYTVRALGDMIGEYGLLKMIKGESTEALRSRVLDVYLAYRKRTLEDIKYDFQHCQIQMIGVWDTVGALGIPLKAFDLLNRELFNFHNTALHSNVQFGYQALAVDEKREDFTPNLWDDRSGVEQVWFSGAHADVGGGYAEYGLSDITLNWMLAKAKLQGVSFLDSTLPDGDPFGIQHFPWEKPPFSLLPIADRVIPENSKISDSVQLRIQKKELDYQPRNLPHEIEWVNITE